MLDLFISNAQETHANIIFLNNLNDVPHVMLDIIKKNNFRLNLRISKEDVLTHLNWHQYPELIIKIGMAENNDDISLTSCLCGVSETGTLVLLANENSPASLNFLPAIHCVLLAKEQIVSQYEDAWNLIRKKNILPRTVHFITGPSRTADIEQTLQLGVHGPRELHILLYDKDTRL